MKGICDITMNLSQANKRGKWKLPWETYGYRDISATKLDTYMKFE